MSIVKIYVAYHNEFNLIKNDVLEPIHVGRAIKTSEWLENNMIGDNTGDNISDKNNRFCELTAQYFVWKNMKELNIPQYVGFMHYRRFFNFNEEKEFPVNNYGLIEQPFINDAFIKTFKLHEQEIENCIKNYDIITVKPTNLCNKYDKNVYNQYKINHHIEDYDIALQILLKKYPEYKEAMDIYNSSTWGYFTNSYIMRKEIFCEYADWLFSILFEADKKIENYTNALDNRVIGFIAERLFGIYLIYKRMQGLKIKELQPIFVQSCDRHKKNIPIVLATNNNYALHMCCAIKSILQNAKPDEFFFFYVLNTRKNLNYINKHLIPKIGIKNGILKYITLDENLFSNMPRTSNCAHISIETYYRFLLSDIFYQLEKILYLDCDITVLSNLSPLFDEDISDDYIGGVKDIIAEESTKRLKLDKYCNAGVLLVNLEKWREDNIKEKLFNYAQNNVENILWQDQDILNIVLQNNIKYIDNTWNAQVGEYDICYETGQNEIGKRARILHHIGSIKPWKLRSKSPFKANYYDVLKTLPWVFKNIYINVLYLIEIKDLIFLIIKNIRKTFIKYDKRKKMITIFNAINIKL